MSDPEAVRSVGKCERGDLNPHGCLAHRIVNQTPRPVTAATPASSRHFGSVLTALAGSKRPRQGTTGHDALAYRTRDPEAVIGAVPIRVAAALFEKGRRQRTGFVIRW